VAADDPLTTERLAQALGPDPSFGAPHQVYPVAVSVDAIALGWLRQEGAPEGAVVVAESELSARGRRGIPWVSVAGGSLAFSVVLRPELPPEAEGLLWPLASLAAAEGVEEATGLRPTLKWPNDVLLAGRRLGLVDVEAQLGPGRLESAVMTVRLNATLEADEIPPNLRDEATSLTVESSAASREHVLARVVERLEARYTGGVSELVSAYQQRCQTLGRAVRAELQPAGEVAGTATSVDGGGRLVLDDDESAALTVDLLTRLVEV
jgi:BirA family biotin operon repressor/biotin-[acetyl-CoA-carboxylase] ligase